MESEKRFLLFLQALQAKLEPIDKTIPLEYLDAHCRLAWVLGMLRSCIGFMEAKNDKEVGNENNK